MSSLVIKLSYGSTSVARVNAGKQATLLCQSNDDSHRFMFWKVIDNNNNIVGPNSSYDNDKYNYEVLTGKLYIWVSIFKIFFMAQYWPSVPSGPLCTLK